MSRLSARCLAGLLVWCASTTFGAGMLTQQDVDQDGEKEFVLENRFCRLVLKASWGAVGTSLKVKPTGTELVWCSEKSRAGLFGDAVWDQGFRGDFYGRAYAFRVLANDANQATIRFRRRGMTDKLQWMTITKTITMRADTPTIEVAYEYRNEEASKETLRLGFWVHNQITAKGQELLYQFPDKTKVRTTKVTSGPSSGTEVWVYEPSRGWMAATAEDGSGLAFEMEYKRLMCFYQYLKRAIRTVEWMYRPQAIPNGRAFRTVVRVIPFAGMPYVDGVAAGVAGCCVLQRLPAPGQTSPMKILLAGVRKGMSVRATVRFLPNVQEMLLLEKKIEKAPEGVMSETVKFTPATEGTYLVRVVFTEGGKPVGEFEKPIIIGKPSARYALRPLEKRLGKPEAFRTSIPLPVEQGKPARAAAVPGELPADVRLADDIRTPHIPWARPLAGGKIRALVITNTQNERDVIELAERIDLDFLRVTHGQIGWKTPCELVKTWSASAATRHLKRILAEERLDAIVMNAPWDTFSPEVQGLFLKRTRQGVGLVLISPRKMPPEAAKLLPVGEMTAQSRSAQWQRSKDHFITRGIPFGVMRTNASIHPLQGEALAVFRDATGHPPLVAVGRLAKGRVVCLNYNPSWYPGRNNTFVPQMIPFQWGCREPSWNNDFYTFDWWEYCYSLLARSIVWAADRDPSISMEPVAVSSAAVTIRLRNRGGPVRVAADLAVRDAFSRVEQRTRQEMELERGDASVPLRMEGKRLSGGLHFADVILRRGEAAVDWGTLAFEVPVAVQVASLKLAKEAHRLPEKAHATATFSAPLRLKRGMGILPMTTGGTPVRRLTTVAKLFDSRGRLLVESLVNAEPGAKSVAFEMPLTRVETVPFYVWCEVWDGPRLLSRKRVRGTVAQHHEWDDFTFNVEVYGGAYHYWEPWYLDQLRKHGASMLQASVSRGHGVPYMLNADMTVTDESGIIPPWSFHHRVKDVNYAEVKANYFRTRDRKWLERHPCFNDPKFREQTLKNIKKYVGWMSRYGVWDYCLIDEMSLTNYGDEFDFCFCLHCLRKFRAWVKTQYKDLAALNQAYGTDFKKWDEVRPLTYLEASEKGKYPGWADHRTFMEISLHEYFAWIRKEARKVYPRAKISISGTQIPHPYNGQDVWLRCKTFDGLWCYQGGGQYAMHRSLNPKLKQQPWLGYAGSGPRQYRRIWWQAFNRAHGVSYWWFLQILNPDWHLSPSGRTWTDACRDLVQGVGKLILDSEFQDYGIAIHYSQASIHGSYARQAHQALYDDRDGWLAAIESNFMQAGFISYEQIENGLLKYPRYKVLIMPYSIAVSDKEAAAIRAYVRAGGTVIADAQTGVMDQHCADRTTGVLDDVLGIKRVSTTTGYVEGAITYKPPKGWRTSGRRIPLKPMEPGVTLAGAEALSMNTGVPAIIRNTFGKGAAWYLNFDLSKYGVLAEQKKHGPLRELARELLRSAGVVPFARVAEAASGADCERCRVYLYRRGPIRYLGLVPAVPEDGKKWTARVNLAKQAAGLNLYDVRGRRDLAMDKGRRFEAGLDPGNPKFYALLPYRVLAVNATAPRRIRQGETAGVAIWLRVDKGRPGRHVLRITVTGPDREERWYYAANFPADRGKSVYPIPFALNDPVGTWTVHVRDVATSRETEVAIELVPAPRVAPLH